MFLIRAATPDDHAVLIRLWTTNHHAGQPADPVEVAEEIRVSGESFVGRRPTNVPSTWLFVMEDTESGATVGSSSIRLSPVPALALEVQRREQYSDLLQTGQVHVTLRLTRDDGPSTRLDRLALLPPYRGHRERLGAFLSLVRLHFIALHREQFAEQLVAALPPPRAERPDDLLWEHLGRRFVNLQLAEAERLMRRDDAFLEELFPDEEIYTAMLPPEARRLIAHAARDAQSAQHILESAGFRQSNRIDPLSGGPFWAATDGDLQMMRQSRLATLGDPTPDHPIDAIVSTQRDDRFRAIRCRAADRNGMVSIPGEAAGLLGVQLGDTVGVSRLSTGGTTEGSVDPTQVVDQDPR